MTVAIVSNGAAANYGGPFTAIAATFPSGHAAATGNLLLAFVSTSTSASVTWTPPAGWTQKHDFFSSVPGVQVACYVKVAAGGETSASFSKSGSAAYMSAHLYELSGADAAGVVSGAVDILAAHFEQTTGGSTTIAATAIDPTSALDVLFMVFARNDNNIGALSWSNSFATETSDTIVSYVGARHITNPGSTTTTATYTNGSTAAGIILAIPTSAVGNVAPTANAGADQANVIIGTAVALDGSGSSDPETPSVSLTYSWAVTAAGGTGLVTGDIVAPTGRTTTMATAGKTPGTATITLTVTDAGALTDTDTMTVNLIDTPAGSINGWVWDGTTWVAL